MTPDEQLLRAAKRVYKYLDAKIQGKYHSDQEDISCGRELYAAIEAVEKQQFEQELVSRR